MDTGDWQKSVKMAKFKIFITALLVVAIAFGAGFYFKSALFDAYKNVGNNLQNFQKNDLGNIINEIKKEVLAPQPLNIGGKENQAVLTKAKIIAQTNVQRFDNGTLPPLIENTKLDAAAMAKAKDMFAKQYFDHVSPSGVDPGVLVKSFGYDYIVTGENLILGNFASEKEVVQDWMNSPGHRANILNDRYVDIGVAIIKGTYKGQTVWIGVQEFGLPLSTCFQPGADLKNQIDVSKNKLDELSLQIDAKKNEIDNTSPKRSEYNKLVDEYNQLVAQYNALAQETKNLISQYNSQVNMFNQCVAGK